MPVALCPIEKVNHFFTLPKAGARAKGRPQAREVEVDGVRVIQMTHGPCNFTQRYLTRTLKAAKAADVPVKIEIEDGKMAVIMDRNWMIDVGRGCGSLEVYVV